VIFPTVSFAAFFVVVFALSWSLMPYPRVWKPFIVVASYVFYGYADWRFCFLLGAMTVWNQALAVVIARARERSERKASALLTLAILGDLATLGWFKYYGFFTTSVASLLRALHLGMPLPLLQIALPVGISFFTFQALSYVIDVRRGKVAVAGWVDFAVYLSFFPHLVAGPIVRAGEFLPQLAVPRDPSDIPVARAFGLIVAGLVKKVVIADVLATDIVNPVFDVPSAHSGLETVVAIYGYAVQIFCDFSAYSDIAIGVALLLGFQFPQNFHRPYTATSFSDFWRRWHMTLSRWLRDYLYIPLGGNQRGRRRTYVNLGLTMVIGGLWHGAAWPFIVWGAMHGGALATERWVVERRTGRSTVPVPGTAAGRVLARVVVFHVVCLAWVFFRSPTLSSAGTLLSRIWSGGLDATLVTVPVVLAIAVGLAWQYVPEGLGARVGVLFTRQAVLAQGAALGLALVVINALGHQGGVAPFLYFRF
jgi:D-alanyl-lipoteichoic acid acyltransferase DltB (MBOAT superfamily)